MKRPGAALLSFWVCVLALVFIVARDLFLPDVRNTEVWLGFELTGWLARVTAPIHWAIFAAGAWGFWHVRPWVWPAATLYAFYVAISHLVWNVVSPAGGGWFAGLWQAALFSVPALALIWTRPPARAIPGATPAA